MTMPDRLRLPLSFDPALLRRDLDLLTAVAWTAHFIPQNYQGDWSAIPLRGPEGARHPIQMIYSDPTVSQFVDTPHLAQCPYFKQVIESFEGDIRCVRLMRLAPGSRILEHRDLDLDVEQGVARIHVPVTTNPDVVFELNRIPVAMAPGEAWYLRLADPHRIANGGTTDRVHLVLDMIANDWLDGQMEQARRSRDAAVQPA